MRLRFLDIRTAEGKVSIIPGGSLVQTHCKDVPVRDDANVKLKVGTITEPTMDLFNGVFGGASMTSQIGVRVYVCLLG